MPKWPYYEVEKGFDFTLLSSQFLSYFRKDGNYTSSFMPIISTPNEKGRS